MNHLARIARLPFILIGYAAGVVWAWTARGFMWGRDGADVAPNEAVTRGSEHMARRSSGR